MSDEAKKKYPILDDIEVPEKLIESWQTTVDMLAKIANMPAALIMRVHSDEIEVFVSSHSSGNVYHRGEKAPLNYDLYCETVMDTQRELLVPNALKDPLWDKNPDIKLGMISYCGLPLTWPGGPLFGTICVLDNKENAYSRWTRDLLERFHDSVQFSLKIIYDTSVERKRVEEKIEESEKKYKTLFEESIDGIFIIDDKGNLLDANKACAKMHGYTIKEFMKLDLKKLEKPETIKLMPERMEKILSGTPLRFETTHYHKDRHIFLVEVSAFVVDIKGKKAIIAFHRDITERKKAEEALQQSEDALRDSEEKYRNLFENASAAMIRTKLDGSGFLAMNRKFIEISGYSEDELLTMPSISLWANPDDRKVIMQRLQENGALLDFEVDIVTKSREIKTCLASMILNSKQGYLENSFVDITERKKAEEALQQTERELSIMNKLADVFLTVPDEEMYVEALRVILEAMESKYGVLGYINENGDMVCPSMTKDIWEQCQVLGKDIVFPHETWGNSIWVRALKEKKILYSNNHFRVPEGHLPISRNISAPIIYQGNVIGLLEVANKAIDYNEKDLKMIEVITYRIAPVLIARLQRDIQEKVRKQAEEELIRSEQLYRNAIESASAIPYLRDQNSETYEFMGIGIKSLTGYDANEITPKIFDSMVQEVIVYGEFANLSEDETKQKFYEQENAIWRTDVRIKTRDGKEKWLIDSCVNILNAEETSYRSLGILLDITDRKQAEELLKQRVEELARLNAELEQFAHISSHDLQEPLRKIQTFGELLKTRYNEVLDDRGRDYLQRMQNTAERMQTLIYDLLAFSRVATKAQPFVPVNLADVLYEVVSDLEISIQKTGGRVEMGDMPTIDADQTQMYQLLQNLISNGLKFHRPDEPPIVKVHGETHDGICQIFVEDNGIGFEEQYLDRIFVIFQRLHGSLEYEGTGIGLAICRKIVERHGGSITAKSEPEKGSTFIVTLPIKQDKGGSNV